jgi:hypothetical protein
VIDLVLRAFPASWRKRYGDELRQLVADVGLSLPIALDLVRAGIVERGRAMHVSLNGGISMVVGPAWRHPTGLAVTALFLLLPSALFVALSILAYQVGVAALAQAMDPLSRWLQSQPLADLVILAGPPLALALAALPLVRLDLRASETGREAVVAVRMRIANTIVSMLALAVGSVLVAYFFAELS